MRGMSRIVLIAIILVLSVNVMAQNISEISPGEDSISWHITLKPVYIFPQKTFKSQADLRKYWQLVQKVKKVYPMAKDASVLVKKHEVIFSGIDDKKTKKEYAKKIEKSLINQYGPTMKTMTTSEGRILIKLIDRETNNTSYALIKELRSGLQAFFWQGVARIFGHNLKDEYDPEEEDMLIEYIIYNLETGML